jgi:hypothetical protein
MAKPIREKLQNKRKIEKEEESVKPTIINDSLIKDYIRTYNKENKIFDQDDLPIWELEHLSLSFKSKSA